MLKELNKTEEGRKLIKENVKTLAFAGPAIGAKDLAEIENIVGKDKMKVLNNKDDILIYLTGNKITTDREKRHSSGNYNINFAIKEGEERYSRPDEIKTAKGKDGKNIYGVIKKFNENDVRTLLQKLKDTIFKKKGE